MIARVLCVVAVLALGGAAACSSAGPGAGEALPSAAGSHASVPAHARSAAWLIWLQDHLLTYGFFV